MYLSKLSARNLKGADLDLDLTRATAIVGENAAGKSRITDAVRLLLVGYLPELGNKPGLTFGLASGPFLEVSGVLTATGGPDLHIRRRWSLDGDAVRTEHQVPDALKKCGVLTVMLNADEYFGLSDRARVDYVFKNVPGSAVDLDALCSQLRAAVVGYEPEFPDVMPAGGPVSTQEFIEFNMGRAAEEGKKAKDWAKRMEETIRGLTGLRAQDDVATAPRSDLLDERARAERELTTLNERKGLKIGAFTAMKSAARRREEIAREVQHGLKDAQEAETLRTKLSLLILEQAKDPDAPTFETLEELTATVGAIVIRKAAHLQDLGRARDLWRDRDGSLKRLDGETRCAYCGAQGDGWKAIKRTELEAGIAEAARLGAELNVKVAEAGTAELEAKERLESARARFSTARNLTAEVTKVRGTLATLEPRIARVQALNDSLASLPPHDPDLAAEVDEIQTKIDAKAQECASLDRVLEQQNARHAELTRLAEAEAARDKAQADEARWKQAGDELRRVQAELVEGAFRPLLRAANAYFPGVMRAPLEYHRGEVGMRVAGQWVGHGTFSGTEKALTYAAIQCALAARSPVRVMLLDEMGRLTRRNTEEVAAQVLTAIGEGRLDQAFCVDPERPEIYRAAGIRLDGQDQDVDFKVVTVHN